MSNALELADEFEKSSGAWYKNEVFSWAEEAESELRRQHEEIEALRKQANAYNLLANAQQEQLSIHRAEVGKAREAAETLQSERDANAILTAENEALRADRDRISKLFEQHKDNWLSWESKRKQLEADSAELKAIKEQGPVGHASEMPGTMGSFTMAVFPGVDVPVGTPLYLLKEKQ